MGETVMKFPVYLVEDGGQISRGQAKSGKQPARGFGFRVVPRVAESQPMDEEVGQRHDVDENFVTGIRKVAPEWTILVVIGDDVGDQGGKSPQFAKGSPEDVVRRSPNTSLGFDQFASRLASNPKRKVH